jgi:cytochrome c553
VNRRVVVVLAVMLLFGAFLVYYTITHQRPQVPADRDHLLSSDPEYCLTCHGRGKKDARSKNHPLNDRCWECHERAR